jgi:hypothetical protein
VRTASGELDRKLKSQVSFFRDTLRSQDGPGYNGMSKNVKKVLYKNLELRKKTLLLKFPFDINLIRYIFQLLNKLTFPV